MTPRLVSVHGGHSGQFCNHASDTLEEVICAYIDKGFAWVGISEHMPPTEARFQFPEERKAGLDPKAMAVRFGRYIQEARRLQKKYARQLEIFVGFETEAYEGALAYARQLKEAYKPDYIVGGVHHILDIPFDYDRQAYRLAVEACGGVEKLYCRYFDLQYAMLKTLQPRVVAHFDLIRLFDDSYPMRWQRPSIARRISRNLDLIHQLDLILDFNVAALRKGAAEPYLAAPLLEQAAALNLAVVPGDDCHGVATAGQFVPQAAATLAKAGFSTDWRKPVGVIT